MRSWYVAYTPSTARFMSLAVLKALTFVNTDSGTGFSNSSWHAPSAAATSKIQILYILFFNIDFDDLSYMKLKPDVKTEYNCTVDRFGTCVQSGHTVNA